MPKIDHKKCYKNLAYTIHDFVDVEENAPKIKRASSNDHYKNPRIIKGIYRMKIIPVTHPARPPLARIRKTIFDTIENRQKINKVLDLCCGSGSLGLEALSRGANQVFFVDQNAAVIKNLNNTIKTWNINEDILNIKAQTYVSDAIKVNFPGEVFDTLFVDLPFPDQHENLVLDNLRTKNLINHDSIVCVRSYKKHHYEHNGFKVLKDKIEGKSHIAFLQLA